MNLKMKKIAGLLLCFVMLFVMLPLQTFGATESGVPTLNSDGYYEIYNADQLYWFAGLVNGTLTDGTEANRSANAILMNDIDVNEDVLNSDGDLNSGTFTEWTPIGYSSSSYYKGIFDGNNYTVNGLYYDKYDTSGNTKFVGMFGFAQGATVKNLTVADSYFAGSWWVGGIVGDANGQVTLENCINKASVKGYQYVGGITGGTENSIKVNNCINHGKIIGVHIVGGLIGVTNYSSVVNNCVNTGDVYLVLSVYSVDIGGFIGRVHRASTIKNCYNTGDLIITQKLGYGTVNVGGFAGTVSGSTSYMSTLENCYFSGNMSIAGISESNTKNRIGNFTGETYGTVKNCYYDNTVNTEYSAIGYSSTNTVAVTGLTTDRFGSGEAAYLLNGSVNNGLFKQTLADDSTPNFTGAGVYKMGSYYTNRFYTTEDLVTLRKIVVGYNETMEYSDVNADKAVDIMDIVRLKKILASIA